MKIIVCAPGFHPNTGGNLVLHKLCHLLRQRGIESYVYHYLWKHLTCNLYDAPDAPDDTDFTKCVVIYPETFGGHDPLNAAIAVRWFLGPPSVDVQYKQHLSYHYAPLYQVGDSEELCVVETWLKHLPLGEPARRQDCWYVDHKGADRVRIPETIHLQQLSNLPPAQLCELLSSARLLVSYDTRTFVSALAALCGCLSVVVPIDGISADEWRRAMPLLSYGVAYGFDKAEIERAVATAPWLLKTLQCTEALTERQIDSMLERIKELQEKTT